MKYCANGVYMESRIFDKKGRNKTIYEKIGGYEGYNVLIQQYKFRYAFQDDCHIFGYSLEEMQKETVGCTKGYSYDKLLQILKKLESANLIELLNYKSFDSVKSKGKIKHKIHMKIKATNPFPLRVFTDEEVSRFKEDKIYYSYAPLRLFELFEERGLDERYYTLYCFLRKWSNNPDFKNRCYMSIENISKHINISKRVVGEMLKRLAKERFLCIHKHVYKGHVAHSYSVLKGVLESFIIQFEKENRDVLEKMEDIAPSLLGDRLEELLNEPAPEIKTIHFDFTPPPTEEELSEWSLEIKYTEKYK